MPFLSRVDFELIIYIRKSHVFNNFLFYTHLLPLFLVCSNRVLRFSANLQDVLELEKVKGEVGRGEKEEGGEIESGF